MKIYVVGIGPGADDQLTPKALAVLNESEIIVGYQFYVESIQHLFPDKEFIKTGMMSETERCKIAVEEALKGKTISVVSSGDPGVYGMAALVYQVAENYPSLPIEVVPGITAACSSAAILGAPINHDFVVISLSDLLTPWEKIIKRLELAAQGDFVICIYNPSSKKRGDYLQKACEILLKYKSKETVCGYVRNAYREGEAYKVLSLKALAEAQLDMFTTVIIGNCETKIINGKMVTPRGYIGYV